MKRLVVLSVVMCLCGLVGAAPTADQAKTKEALRELQEFIGGWKGAGQFKERPTAKDATWDETHQWNWRFKGDDCWLSVEFKNGKFLKSADIRWLPATKKYEMTAVPAEGKEKLIFTGTLKDEKLVFERKDEKTKEVQRIRINTAAEGIRLVFLVDRRTETGTIWKFEYKVAANKDGESLAKKKSGPECVVSGGLGTMAVSFGGETFYVCCSGCAEAFRENPKKFVDEFKKNKKK